MPATWVGAHSSNFARGRAGGWRPSAIVIHVMDGSLVGTDAWFNDPASRVSAHYGIGKDGTVHQYVKETDTAFHAGTVEDPSWRSIRRNAEGRIINPNFYTIGIEHAGWGEKPAPWPRAQLDSSLELARDIAARWDIPLDADHIVPHRMIRRTKPNCPGKGLVFADYLSALGGSAPIPAAAPERPFNELVRAVATLNVRRQASRLGIAPRKLLPGDRFEPVAVAQGETHRGNRHWYRNSASEYIWAGGTDRPVPA